MMQWAAQQESARTKEPVKSIEERLHRLLRFKPAVRFLSPDRLIFIDSVEAVVWDLSRSAPVGRFLFKDVQSMMGPVSLIGRAGPRQVLLNNFGQLEHWTVPLLDGQPFIRKALRLTNADTLTLIEPPAGNRMDSLIFNQREDTLSGFGMVASPEGNWLATRQKGKITLWDLRQLKKRAEIQAAGELEPLLSVW